MPVADFSTKDHFSPDNAFTEVEIGNNTKILETELNELQKIGGYRANMIGKIILANGFLTKSAMSVVGGKLIVPADTIVINGEAHIITENMSLAVVNGDVIYLAFKHVEVTGASSLYKDGNLSGGTPITNNIYDVRMNGMETTRRVQAQVQLTKTNTDSEAVYLTIATMTSDSTFNDTRAKCSLAIQDAGTLSAAQMYTDAAVAKIQCLRYTVTATTEGQTDFIIPLETFNIITDTVLVEDRRNIIGKIPGILGADKYSVPAGTRIVRLNTGVPNGTSLELLVFKAVKMS
jgi:hypothetical protein